MAKGFNSFLMTKLLSTYLKCITFKIGIFYKMHFNPSILISILSQGRLLTQNNIYAFAYIKINLKG